MLIKLAAAVEEPIARDVQAWTSNGVSARSGGEAGKACAVTGAAVLADTRTRLMQDTYDIVVGRVYNKLRAWEAAAASPLCGGLLSVAQPLLSDLSRAAEKFRGGELLATGGHKYAEATSAMSMDGMATDVLLLQVAATIEFAMRVAKAMMSPRAEKM